MKKFFQKFKKDSADAMLVSGIIAVPLLALCSGLAVDITKNTTNAVVYKSSAQSSVEAAVKTINARGSLTQKSVEKLVEEYEKQAGPSMSHTAEASAWESKKCSTAEIDGVERTLPYYKVTLDTSRGQGTTKRTSTWNIEGSETIPVKPNFDFNVKYQVISADIYTSSSNVVLSMAGIPCQVFKSSVSAISFGDQSDL